MKIRILGLLAIALLGAGGCSSSSADPDETVAPIGSTGAAAAPAPWDPVDPKFKGCEGG